MKEKIFYYLKFMFVFLGIFAFINISVLCMIKIDENKILSIRYCPQCSYQLDR